MSKTGCIISHEGIGYLCGLIRDINGLDTNLIDDLNIKSNGTFSSVRINTLLNALKTDCNDFANSLVANLSRLELRVVTNEADMIEHNKLYLIKKSGETSYSQYVIVTNDSGVDEKILLGTTDISMTDYLKITDAVATYCKKTDFDALKTEVTNLKTKVGTDTLNTTSQTLTGGVNELKTELDLKANNSEVIKKTDITTTIDENSTDTQVPTAKSVYDKVKSIVIKQISTSSDSDTIENYLETLTPNVDVLFVSNRTTGELVTLTGEHLFLIEYRKVDNLLLQRAYQARDGKLIACRSKNWWSNTWGTWKKLCTTNVADVPLTKIKLNSGFTGVVSYEVKNGVCYVNIDAFKSEKTGQALIVSETLLPKPSIGTVTSTVHFDRDETRTGMVYIVPFMDNRLRMHCCRADKDGWCTFSYPVAES